MAIPNRYSITKKVSHALEKLENAVRDDRLSDGDYRMFVEALGYNLDKILTILREIDTEYAS